MSEDILEVRYSIWAMNNNRQIGIMFDQELVVHPYACGQDTTEGALAKALARVEGIEGLDISRYSVVITRAILLGWDELLPEVMEACRKFLSDPKGANDGRPVEFIFISDKQQEDFFGTIDAQRDAWMLGAAIDQPGTDAEEAEKIREGYVTQEKVQ